MSVFGMSDAFHIVEPLISGINLTTWVMSPMYIVGYGSILLVVELIKKYNKILING